MNTTFNNNFVMVGKTGNIFKGFALTRCDASLPIRLIRDEDGWFIDFMNGEEYHLCSSEVSVAGAKMRAQTTLLELREIPVAFGLKAL